MDIRILELIKNPQLIQKEDIKIIETEIEKKPFMQSLRAIYLLGIHRFFNEDFQQELTKTAAYTTDKKILYHFINQKETQSTEAFLVEEKEEEKPVLKPKTDTVEQEEPWVISRSEGQSYAQSPMDFYTQKREPEVEQETFLEPKNERKSIMDFYTSKAMNVVETEDSSISQNNDLQQTVPQQNLQIVEQPEEQNTPPQEYDWKPMDFYTTSTAERKQEEPISYLVEEESPLPEVEETKTPEVEDEIPSSETESNVTSFINTWQSWLKIEREDNPPTQQDKTSAIIDRFIENNPKISQVKTDVEFVVKERDDDISHLMTETLAQLYWEQKLYAKAVNAYKILQEKYPEKADEYEELIKNIKKQTPSVRL